MDISNILKFILWFIIILCCVEMAYTYYFKKNKTDKDSSNTSDVLPATFNDYINLVNLINQIYDDCESVNECNTLIEQCAEVAPNVDTDCKTLSNKHIMYWRITYITRVETKYLLVKDYWDKYRMSYPINTRITFDKYLARINSFIERNRK